MKKANDEPCSLKFEEYEEVKELSAGGIGVGALIITTVAVVVQVLMHV